MKILPAAVNNTLTVVIDNTPRFIMVSAMKAIGRERK